ncbi:MAG: hypothetical protein ACJAU0_001917, partial [Flavobacteriales bacterium]
MISLLHHSILTAKTLCTSIVKIQALALVLFLCFGISANALTTCTEDAAGSNINYGWVDFITRKHGQVDFLPNTGGIFAEAIDVAQAANSSEGAVNFSDFDNGYGTHDVAGIHFGLPRVTADEYIHQANYPNISGEPRLQFNREIPPANFAYQLYEIAPAAISNNAPEGQDDIIFFVENNAISFDALMDNGNGEDSDPDGDPLLVMGNLGLQPIYGTAFVGADGTITYTPDANFIGIDSLTYFLSDTPAGGGAGLIDEVTVYLVWGGSNDNCVEPFNPFTWTEIPPNDDSSVGPLPLGFDFDLYGTSYTDVYVNNNGNVSFDNPYWWYSSTGFPITTPMVAPFWGDVDTRDWLANGYSGEVWYFQTATALYVTWVNVGVYSANNASVDGLGNTFTLVMTDGNDPALTIGNNVGFFYGDMQWTTGTASGGADGFGGDPATVGINAGDNVNFILIGMFDSDSEDYDGPAGNNDGVNWLDDQCLEFNVSDDANFPPIAQNFPAGNAVNLCLGDTYTSSVSFIGPETGEVVSVVSDAAGWAGFSEDTNTAGNPGSVNYTLTGDVVGTYAITFDATDNNVDPETTTRTITVNVIDCDCSASPLIICAASQTANADSGACEAIVSVTAPAITLDCLGSTAIEFDGVDDFIDVNDPLPDGAFSIEFWFNPGAANWDGVLFDMTENAPGNGGNQRYFFIDASDSDMRWRFESADDTGVDIDITHDFSAIQWYHVVATGNFNSSGPHELFIDGVLEGSSNAVVNSKPATFESPRLGNFGSAYVVDQNAFAGKIDNFRMYNVQLDVTQIDEVKCGNISNVAANILTFLDFENGAGSAIASDISALGNNGVLTNMNTTSAWVTSDLETECTTFTNDYNGTEDASDAYPVGTTTITWTASNVNGGVSACTQDITVIDNQNPVVVCSSNISVNTNAAGCTANVTILAPSTSDNCAVVSTTNNFNGTGDASGNYPDGTTTVVWTAVDAAGNTSTCSQTITVLNTLSANAGANFTFCEGDNGILSGAASGGSSPYTYTWNNGLGAGQNQTVSPSLAGYANENTTYTLTVTDANGCTDTDAITITVESNPDVTVTTTDATCGLSNGMVTFTFSNHPNQSSIEFSLDNGASWESQVPDNIGSVSYSIVAGTYTVITRWGNNDCPVSLGAYTIADIDTTNPTIACPSNITASTSAAACTASVTVPAPTVNDNCSVGSVVNDFNGTNNASGVYPIGVTTVNWTVTDYNGNTATCWMTVTVVDDVNPTISCASDVINVMDPGSCFASVTLTNPTTNDNCSVASVTN